MSAKSYFLAPALVLALTAAPAALRAQAVLNLQEMGKRMPKKEYRMKLKAMPDSTPVESKGQRMTLGEVRAKEKQMSAAATAKMKTAAAESKVRFDDYAAKFNERRQVKLKADNQKVNAELVRLQQKGGSGQGSRRAAIENEARELAERYKNADPAEKVRIDRRAGELLRQLGS
jgi:hypothetical protein